MYLEVRPGEGGDDAVDFANELFTALLRQCDHFVVQTNRTLVAEVDGDLSEFVGTHRIQRIPKNDKRGRRHTSTATVALLNVPRTEPNVSVCENDIEVTYYKAPGAGGQKRNKTMSGVRLHHLPTGIIVTCAESRIQQRNRESARERLEVQLTQRLRDRQASNVRDTRNSQIQSGERPVKEFTHNQQRNETLDHSTGRRWRMDQFLKGRI